MPPLFILLLLAAMDDGGFSMALSRAERALARIEQSLAKASAARVRDEELRSKVREAITELDQMIRAAGA